MPNHVHLILVPGDADGLRRGLAPLHRYYAGHIHARQRRTGTSGKAALAASRWTMRIAPPRSATC
jgi:hypothetical protein